ncbi:MAG: diguanylate cyclase [Selenomonadaceae bacterium]|nr:diguanylate cyclase [Selenomonadaceae bacterium]
MTDLQDANLEPWEKISAAVGMAIYDPARHTNAHDVFNEADEKMYANKRAMKAGRE